MGRSLRPKGGEELSMKQVACSFGGLYAIIYLLQSFSLWTLLIFAIMGYMIYRQVKNTIQLVSASGEETSSPRGGRRSRRGARRTRATRQRTPEVGGHPELPLQANASWACNLHQ